MNFTRDLSFGSWGSDVRELQLILNQLGYASMMGTGFFGNKTLESVIRFQISNNITPAHGYVGPKTRFSLSSKVASSNRERLWNTAYASLGIDVTPSDIVPDEVGCAETVNQIYYNAFKRYIGGGASTYNMYKCLLVSNEFIKVDTPLYGDIIISPTGYGNGNLSNGHVGIVSKDNKIMSNSSATGLFQENYTIDSWKKRYVDKGGYPCVFFRKV